MAENDQGDYQLVPIEGGRLMIVDREGNLIMGNQDFPSPEVAMAALRDFARQQGREIDATIGPSGVIGPIREVDPHPDVTIELTLPAWLLDNVFDSASTMGIGWDEAIHKAIRLLKIATDAAKEGNHLAVISPDDEIVKELFGFRRPPSHREPGR